jgi:LCP family protein required for cell wall assembly
MGRDTGHQAISAARELGRRKQSPEDSMTRSRRGGARNLRQSRGQRRGSNLGRGPGAGQYPTRTLVTGWSAIGVTFLLVAGALFGYVKYRDVLDGINHIAVTDLGKRPHKFSNAMNLLLIGSDSRSGRNGKIGGRVATGQRSDTVMIVHISPGHSHIYVLSFPRDTLVPIFGCAPEPGFNGQTAQTGVTEQLNSTFAFGGPGCLWKTLEQMTQIRIDDFVELNFTGFISVINALGGVEVCLPAPVVPSSYDHLSLTAGRHFLKGYRALEFWRLREDFGLSSDLQRIQRDQLLMVGVVHRILKTGVLHSLTKSYSIVSAIVRAHALTTDAGLTPTKILDIGRSMAGIHGGAIQFVEIPTVADPANRNWVELDSTQDPKLFGAVAHDVKLPKVHKGKKGKVSASKGKGTAKGNSSNTAAPKLLSTSKVSVEVLNGSDVQGIAGTTEAALAARGFHTLGAFSAASFSYTESVVQYASTADLAAARTVAAQLGKNVTLQLSSSVTAGTVNLILGSDFTALAPQQIHPRSPGNLAKQYSGYTGGTNVCKGYGSAFAGA